MTRANRLERRTASAPRPRPSRASVDVGGSLTRCAAGGALGGQLRWVKNVRDYRCGREIGSRYRLAKSAACGWLQVPLMPRLARRRRQPPSGRPGGKSGRMGREPRRLGRAFCLRSQPAASWPGGIQGKPQPAGRGVILGTRGRRHVFGKPGRRPRPPSRPLGGDRPGTGGVLSRAGFTPGVFAVDRDDVRPRRSSPAALPPPWENLRLERGRAGDLRRPAAVYTCRTRSAPGAFATSRGDRRRGIDDEPRRYAAG